MERMMIYKKLSVVMTAVILMSGCATVETESWQNCAIGGALLGGAAGGFVEGTAEIAAGTVVGGTTGGLLCDTTTLAKAGVEPDTDSDGIVDSRDECPSTQPNAAVGSSGCSSETDDVRELALRNVNFHTASAQLTSSAKTILRTIIKDSNDSGGALSLVISGYTDSVGADDYNQGLSERRAESVRNFMVANGYAADLLSIKWFGESNATADNTTSVGRARNRRVELNEE